MAIASRVRAGRRHRRGRSAVAFFWSRREKTRWKSWRRPSRAIRDIIQAQQLLLDLTQDELLQRIIDLLPPRGGEDDGVAYIGSTSDPAWRWEGGLCWRCERNEADPPR